MIIRTANKHKDPSTGNQVDGFGDEPNAIVRGQSGYELQQKEDCWLVIFERETRDGATGVLMVERTVMTLYDVIEERTITVQPKAAKNVKAKPAKTAEAVS